ncbi:MAG: hypothetical protein J0H71_15120 [Rhizobiales bacterium]|nr:hypothetical protein [Hyphomicrobiales bacterium]
MESNHWFLLVVMAMALQLLALAAISARNVARQIAKGAVVIDDSGIGRLNIALRCGWLLAMIAEVDLLQRAVSWPIFAVAAIVTVLAFLLRAASMWQLGERWTLPTVVTPGARPEDGGIYHYLRHPNWLGVVMEIVGIPMLHGAWLTATIFLVLELMLLRYRAGIETDALLAATRDAVHLPLRRRP